MNDLDQHIHLALDKVVSAAPPPVAAEAIHPLQEPRVERGLRRHLRLALALPAAVIALGSVVMIILPTDDSPSVPGTEIQAIEPSPTDTGPSAEAGKEAQLQFTTHEGQWLSEMVHQIAGQLPEINATQLWTALESAEPRPPFSPIKASLDSIEIPGLSQSRIRWEGLLLPSTYVVDLDDEAVDVVARMHDEFVRVTADLGYDNSARTVGLSPREVVILASLVEAETPANEADRSKIARVIHNRLTQGLPLALDAPYVYAAQDREIELSRSLLETPGPYALRLRTGLPPTPISSPGEASLQAAIDPAAGPWLFYNVADEQGSYFFATTLAEHNANKAAARERRLPD